MANPWNPFPDGTPNREGYTRITRALDSVMAQPDAAAKWAYAAEIDARRGPSPAATERDAAYWRGESDAYAAVGDHERALACRNEATRLEMEAAEPYEPDYELEPPPERIRGSWWPQDFEDVLDGSWSPPEPTIGRRSDGAGLFYPGRSHSVVSESEAGKSWLALSAATDEMRAGHTVVFIDFEDDRGGVVGRLLTMGISRDLIRTHFRYVHPDAALAGDHLLDLLDVLIGDQPTLAILDGVTEAMAVHGLDPIGNFDAAKFGHQVTTRLLSTGAAVVSLDHVVKAKDDRGRYALGAVHKLNAISGAQYVLENVTPFGAERIGKSTLRIVKDRPGRLRKRALRGDGSDWYGSLIVDSQGDEFAEVSIEPPTEQSEDFRPTALMTRVAELLVQHPGGLSKRMIRSTVKGKEAAVIQALDFLILDGFVTASTPHQMLRTYVVDQDDTP